MRPVPLSQIIRPERWLGSVAERLTNALLLAPVVGAFLQVLLTHRIPSMGWALLLVACAFVTRLLRVYGVVRERAAVLGEDGLLVEGRFLPVAELARVERESASVRVTATSGARFELRVTEDEWPRVGLVVHALGQAIATSHGRDTAGEHLVTALAPGELQGAGSAYRELPLDAGRCLAIAEDVAAAPAARIAAARRIATHEDPAVRVRIAEVAQATANPALREAMEAHGEFADALGDERRAS